MYTVQFTETMNHTKSKVSGDFEQRARRQSSAAMKHNAFNPDLDSPEGGPYTFGSHVSGR